MLRKSPAQGYCQREIFESAILPNFLAKEHGTPLPRLREAIILGGQPGAGNSALLQMLRQVLEPHGTTWVINGDDFYACHPMCVQLRKGQGIAATRRVEGDIRAWVAMTVDAARERGVNIILESTMRPLGNVVKQLKALRHSNYKIQACVLAVKEQESWQRVHTMYEHVAASGGYSPQISQAMHKTDLAGLVKAVKAIETKGLVDRVVVRNRSGDLIFDNGKIKTQKLAADAIEKECSVPFSAERIAKHTASWNAIEGMALQRHKRERIRPMQAAQELTAIRTQRRGDELTLNAERDRVMCQVTKSTIGRARE